MDDGADAQIARCHEKIAENMMPCIFRQILKKYLAGKTEQV
jgi:hypothetical protein